MAICENLAMLFPYELEYQQDLAATYHSLANLLREANKLDSALELHRKSMDIREKLVTDFNCLLGVLSTGAKSRAFASTAMNQCSSRGHTIFRITIESRQKEPSGENDTSLMDGDDDGAVRVSTLNLVDLAGSESVRHTGATGDRQKEGGMINQR